MLTRTRLGKHVSLRTTATCACYHWVAGVLSDSDRNVRLESKVPCRRRTVALELLSLSLWQSFEVLKCIQLVLLAHLTRVSAQFIISEVVMVMTVECE